MKPLIAITAGEVHNQIEPWSPITHGQSLTYIEAILHAGGTPFIVPLIDDEMTLRQLYELANGILFAGGNDPDPALYGAAKHPKTVDISPLRDKVESTLLNWTLQDKKPFIGICRGIQLLNIVKGGELYQDIPSELPNALDHNSSTKRESLEDIAHQLRIAPDSRFASLVGSAKLGANTHHHQAIKTLGTGLVVNSWSEDDLIEGIELTDASHFGFGVQSHPESLEATAEIRWQKFFSGLTEAARTVR